jgi:hypothetical protein
MKRPALGHILGYTALTVILTSGAAQSLSGSNTVFTDDIVDNHVTNADLGSNSVTSNKVASNTLTGSDINESTLDLPKVLKAFVRVYGQTNEVISFSGAQSVTRTSEGAYRLKFDRNITACVPAVIPGIPANLTGNASSGPFSPTASAFSLPTDEIAVLFLNDSGAAADTSFMLTLAC